MRVTSANTATLQSAPQVRTQSPSLQKKGSRAESFKAPKMSPSSLEAFVSCKSCILQLPSSVLSKGTKVGRLTQEEGRGNQRNSEAGHVV